MSGTHAGGLKTLEKILSRNPNHFSDIGKLGGKASNTGGFYGDPVRASRMGKLGGRPKGYSPKTERVEQGNV